MKKLLLWLLFLSPVWLMSQEVKNGTLTIDFGKKKKQANDSVQQQTNDEEQQDTVAVKPHRAKKQKSIQVKSAGSEYDYKKDGIFSALFHAGFNTAQIDGDYEYGYKYFGFQGGIGALARFHKVVSLSLELNYSMLGGRARLPASSTNLERYVVQLDYLEAPVAVNLHYKQWLMFTIGMAPGFLTRYKELDYDGINITNRPNPLGEPRKFGMSGFGGVTFIIKQHYALGWKFGYSMIKIRNGESGTRVNGEYNNFMAFDFMYILHGVKKKK